MPGGGTTPGIARRFRLLVFGSVGAVLLAAAVLVLGLMRSAASAKPIVTATLSVPTGLAGRLLYTRDAGLWALDLATGVTRQAVPPPDDGRVLAGRWSADGQSAAWSSVQLRGNGQPPSWQVATTAADGSQTHTVVTGVGSESFLAPVWGPDDQSVYVLHTGRVGNDAISPIERVDLRSGARTAVFDQAGENAFFDVSPDGRWLAVSRVSRTGPSLTVMDLASGDQREVIHSGEYPYLTAVRFDRQSQTITFSAALPLAAAEPRSTDMLASIIENLGGVRTAEAHGLPQDLWSIPVGGGRVTPIVSLGADDPVAAWSPDASHLAILSVQSLSIMDGNGNDADPPTPIQTPGASGSLDWAN
jgi:Tol biopolymer transport system component